MDEDLQAMAAFPSPPSDDIHSFLDDLANDTLLFDTPYPCRISLPIRKRKSFVELTGSDLLHRMRQKTHIVPSHLLRKTVIDREACAVAGIENDRLGYDLTMDDWENHFWMQRDEKRYEEGWRDIWRDQYHLVLGDIRRRMRRPPPIHRLRLGLPPPPSWFRPRSCHVCSEISRRNSL